MTAPRVPISDLTAAGALADADLLPVVQSGSTKKATIADFVTKAQPIRQGLLSARPAASSVPDSSCYFATDENGGTLYIEVSNAWVKIAAGNDAAAGQILASANPTSAAAVSTTSGSTYYRIPELTTSSFTMPSNTCTVTMGTLKFSSVSVAGTLLQLRYTTDAWSTSKIMGGWSEASFASNTSVFDPVVCRLAEVSTLTAPSAGATVQVAPFVNHPSDTSVSPAVLHALFNLVCLIEVRAG